MRHLTRVLVLAVVGGLLAAGPAAASASRTAVGSSTGVATSVALSSAKVVIIVGPTQGATSSYRSDGDAAYAAAVQYSSNVVKVYSPNATWSAVQSAVAGASIVVYLGHGNGWPAPYPWDPKYTTRDGFGLNDPANLTDNVHKYYGEPAISTLQFAPNAVVLLNHLCYASGNSEPGNPEPTTNVAMQRVDNYGQGFLAAGARAVIAEGRGGLGGLIRDLFTTHQTVVDAWRNQYDYHGNEFSFQSPRSPAYTAFMDPDQPSSGYYRSFIGNPDLRTDDVTGVPYVPTDTAPASLQSPGAATVAAGGATLYADSSLASTTGLVAPGQAVRVDSLAGGSPGVPAAAHVRTLNGSSQGWTQATTLVPQDSQGPQLWSADGSRAISPNGDGIADTMSLAVRFSESVAWSAAVRNSSGTPVWSTSGNGATATLAWDAKVGGGTAPNGTYVLTIAANDAWGNPNLASQIVLIVDSARVPVRLSGPDRYATAAAISAATYAPGVPVAYIATGENFADALAGAPAAGSAGGPILLVPTSSIPSVIAAELTRLQPARIVVLGGPSVVWPSVLVVLKAYIPS
ncbi:MAG: cell wall-binding repeat-containing protein [Chloroflexi bacterium]|nr:cell wall-binding repeat-containing protein [Chloroflexota bacterium]